MVVVVVVVVLLLLGATFILSDLCKIQKNYENKSVDTSEIKYCAKFQPSVTSIFAKNDH